MWQVEQYDSGVHVYPIDDLLVHEMDDSGQLLCACLPFVQPVPRDDGSFGWVITHSAWDGRK